jgi:alpha-L-fucosidase
VTNARYAPSWESLDARPLPAWFAHDKIGIFLHWGPYSVPGYAVHPKGGIYGEAGHACWYQATLADNAGVRQHRFDPKHRADFLAFHARMFGAGTTYEEVAPHFKAELWDAEAWAELFQRAGARWAILTAKFHDGFCLWPSSYSAHWNSAVIGPKRDVLGEFTAAVRANGLRSGFYYSLLEHNHPLYTNDATLEEYVRAHLHPQFREVVTRYAPSFIYLDGEWEFPEPVWRTRELLAWLYNESPCRDEVVVNDRAGKGTRGKHGDVFSSEIGMEKDRETAHGFSHPWIEDRPLADWSYNRTLGLDDHLSERDMIHLVVETVANGGSVHIAVSPRPDGIIPLIQQERLAQLGDWLQVNGEAIYGSRPRTVRSEGIRVPTRYPYLNKEVRWSVRTETPLVHYTARERTVYAICMTWPKDELVLRHAEPTRAATVRLLGHPEPLRWSPAEDGGMRVEVPRLTVDEVPCRAAYVFALEGLVEEGYNR